MSKMLEKIVSSYKIATEQSETTAFQDLTSFFRNRYVEGFPYWITGGLVVPIFKKMTKDFYNFAIQQR